MVGLTDAQIRQLPPGIIGIAKTASLAALAGIYSAADVFINPTLEDNFPTTNLDRRKQPAGLAAFGSFQATFD